MGPEPDRPCRPEGVVGGTGREGHLADLADGEDFPALDDEHAVGDGLPGDGDNLGARENLGLFLCAEAQGQTEQQRHA